MGALLTAMACFRFGGGRFGDDDDDDDGETASPWDAPSDLLPPKGGRGGGRGDGTPPPALLEPKLLPRPTLAAAASVDPPAPAPTPSPTSSTPSSSKSASSKSSDRAAAACKKEKRSPTPQLNTEMLSKAASGPGLPMRCAAAATALVARPPLRDARTGRGRAAEQPERSDWRFASTPRARRVGRADSDRTGAAPSPSRPPLSSPPLHEG